MPNPTLNTTLVTELKVTLATLRTRTLVCKAAGAASMQTHALFNTSFILTDANPYTITSINKTLTLVCNNPITLSYYDSDILLMTQIVTNQYAFNGSIAAKIVLHKASAFDTSVTLIYG